MLPLLWIPLALAAKPEINLPSPATTVQGSRVVASWDCATATLDASDRKGRGHAACLRGFAVDTATGETWLQLTVALDSPRAKPLADYNLWIETTRADRTRRRLRLFGTAEATAQIVKRPAERGEERQLFDVVFAFDTFDHPSPITELELRLVGSGGTTWGFSPPVTWPPATAPRSVAVTRNPAQSCAFDEVRASDTREVAGWLTGSRQSADLGLSFGFALDDGDGEVQWTFPREDFYVRLSGERLVVRGAETFDTRLSGLSRIQAQPTPVTMDFDGDEVLVAVGDQRFGPFFVRQRPPTGRAPEVELSLDGDASLVGLAASMCTPVPEEAAAPPPPPPPPPPAPASSAESRVVRDGVDPAAELARIQATLGGMSGSVQVGGMSASVQVGSPAQPAPSSRPAAVDYASLEIVGLTPLHQITLDGSPLSYDQGTGRFFAPRVRDGQRLRIVDKTLGLDWSADTHPEQLGMHEVCQFTPTGSSYAIACQVTGPVSGASGGGFGGVAVQQGPQPMGAGQFADLLRRIDDATFSSDQMDLVRTVARDHHFDTGQIGKVMEQFNMDNDKVAVAVVLYPRCTEPENWYQVYDHLTFSSSKDELRRKTR